MHKVTNWVIGISIFVFIIAWGIVGVKILNGDYNITAEAYISRVAFIVCLAFLLGRKFADSRWPHCGKVRFDTGKYCSYCGKEV